MAERWISSKELSKHLCIGRDTLIRHYPIFTEGVHYRLKDPFNPLSHKVWKLSEVERLLSQSRSALHRRLVRKQAAAK
tara:strand:- start:2483 stop:2716 length:234 start_codon:yes stop_codon:yes gene_type:complete